MLKHYGKRFLAIFNLLFILSISLAFLKCEDDEAEEEKPIITGCRTFTYKGISYTSGLCERYLGGTEWVSIWQYEFYIECYRSGGCLKSVTLIGPREDGVLNP
ncbi:MAG: hypothetical protein JSU77_11245 [Fidelibacterota bacterium]|nr:MAG: hypothetical protein JSU77_11245 [Candidatus Neomarinimicrobiota bacterium]